NETVIQPADDKPGDTSPNETVNNSKPEVTEQPEQPQQPTATKPPTATPQPDKGVTDSSKPPRTDSDKPASNNGSKDHGTPKPSPSPYTTPTAPIDQERVTALGDSVILDARPYLEKLLPGIVIDGKVGRQFVQAIDVIDA